jgi:biotin/methionine sulfoxide reductase
VWLEKAERLGAPRARQYPLYMMSTQPANRLHSQLDFGRTSMADKNKGREPIRINDEDAADRGIAQGDIVRVYNDRGAFLASAIVTDALRRGVTQIATGAWYDPDPTVGGKGLERHGNPNVVTRDVGTSKLAQGPSAQSCLVQIERFTGPLPAVEAFKAPEILNL